jgi:hypothetical protein
MGARIVAFTALFAVAGALAFVITGTSSEREKEPAAVDVAGLAAPLEEVALELERLEKGDSARPAQRATRRAVDATEQLKSRSEVTAGERVVNALERTLEYLDAVGSLLSNRRSPLRSEIEDRARRAAAALDAAPGGSGAAIRGWQELLDR